jgi:hypothetical protein
MSLILGTNSIKDTGYNVANSCRFNDGSSDHLSRSISSTGNRRTYTISTWFKRGSTGANQKVITAGSAGTEVGIQFFSGTNDDALEIYQYSSSAYQFRLDTSALLRDTSAWYHLVVAIDTTQGTDSNRVKIYLNGSQITSFSTATYPSQNLDTLFNNSGTTNYIGFLGSHSAYFDGYMAETVLVDGQQLDATSFGEFDEDSGIWKPKDVSGLTFGTNGFYLDYEDSSALGNDAAGSNNFTVNNLTAIDQSTDTCTNNFATMLPITKSTDATFSEGNLNVTYGTASTRRSAFGSIAVSSGKWYWETKITATSSTSVEINLGISSTYNPDLIGNALISTNGYSVSFFPSNGSLYIGNTQDETSLGNVAVNDIIGHALDIDNGTLQFYKNGSALGSANDITTSGSNVGELYPLFTPAVSCSSGDQTFTASYNFGSPSHSISSGNADGNGHGNFEYAVPSGYYALNTKNLAEYG